MIETATGLIFRTRPLTETSLIVHWLTPHLGRLGTVAKGARRLRSKFGAALDLFAQSRIIYYSHETRTLFTLSDAELIRSFSSIAEDTRPGQHALAATG